MGIPPLSMVLGTIINGLIKDVFFWALSQAETK